ncbi:MAG: hypothetical protein WCO98_16950 [bacterium]
MKSGDLVECAYTILLTAAKNALNPLTYLRVYLNAAQTMVANFQPILAASYHGKQAQKILQLGNYPQPIIKRLEEWGLPNTYYFL